MEFAGIISNPNEYRLLKLGYHKTESSTIKLYKTCFLKNLKETTDEEFIKIVEYMKENQDLLTTTKMKNLVDNFLGKINRFNKITNENIRVQWIGIEIKWEKTHCQYCTISTIMTELIKQSLPLFTKLFLRN